MPRAIQDWNSPPHGAGKLTGSDPKSSQQLAESITQLYEEHHAAFFRYLVVSGSTPTEADDLIQEAFLRLFRQLGNPEQVDNPRSWLLRVMQNLRIDSVRRRKRECELDRPEFEYLAQQLCSQEADAESRMIAQERDARVKTALRGLSPRQCEYLMLRAEGLKLREIAEVFRVKVQTVSESCAKAMLELGRVGNE